MKTLITLTLVAIASLTVAAAPPVRTMYRNAMGREQAVRPALAATDATAGLLTEVRAVVSAYESVWRHYPASSYSDNALWQAGVLSLDAFEKFGQARDRDTGIRLLRALAASYATSKLARQVPGQLARAQAPAGADDARAQRRTVASAPTPIPAAAGAGRTAGSDDKPGAGTAVQTGATLSTISAIRRTVLPDAVRVTIDLDGEVPFHDERIADPARVFIDLPGTRAVPALADRNLRFDGDADIVRQIRIGRHPQNMTRIVLDGAGISSYSVYPLYGPYRLVIDCVRAAAPAARLTDALSSRSAAAPAKPPAAAPVKPPAAVPPEPAAAVRPPAAPLEPRPLTARRLTPVWSRHAPSVSPRSASAIAGAYAALGSPLALDAAPRIPDLAPVRPVAPTPPPLKNLGGGFSIARQLGLGVSRIVIDPGHGGHDPGARGKSVSESEVVLDVALRLEKLLQKVPGVEVILTRRTDDFIPLPERTAIANREGADLFLSIHANASTNTQARGIETYFLNFASNLSAAGVAARENAASGQAMGALPDIVKAIALNNKLDESRDFANEVQHAMIDRLRGTNKTVKDLGVKQAPFVVLIGAAMPSVLAEISFVTNTQEARLLKAGAYRDRIAEALFSAIRKYQSSLNHTTTVAPQ